MKCKQFPHIMKTGEKTVTFLHLNCQNPYKWILDYFFPENSCFHKLCLISKFKNWLYNVFHMSYFRRGHFNRFQKGKKISQKKAKIKLWSRGTHKRLEMCNIKKKATTLCKVLLCITVWEEWNRIISLHLCCLDFIIRLL